MGAAIWSSRCSVYRCFDGRRSSSEHAGSGWDDKGLTIRFKVPAMVNGPARERPLTSGLPGCHAAAIGSVDRAPWSVCAFGNLSKLEGRPLGFLINLLIVMVHFNTDRSASIEAL
jgi:hypothetical protein